jgi:hypothetical protein
VNVRKQFISSCVYICMASDIKVVCISRPSNVRFQFVGLDEERICKTKMDTLPFAFCYFSASINKREDQFIPETHDLRTGVSQVRTGWRWDLLIFTVNRSYHLL